MIVPTYYVDTSVIGGLLDDEFAEASGRLFAMAEAGKLRLIVSTITQREIAMAPDRVIRAFAERFPDAEKILEFSPSARALAAAYLEAGVVSEKYADDAGHVAIAVTNGLGILVSWNFRHLANIRREAEFNRVNSEAGYAPIRIVSPLEVVYAD